MTPELKGTNGLNRENDAIAVYVDVGVITGEGNQHNVTADITAITGYMCFYIIANIMPELSFNSWRNSTGAKCRVLQRATVRTVQSLIFHWDLVSCFHCLVRFLTGHAEQNRPNLSSLALTCPPWPFPLFFCRCCWLVKPPSAGSVSPWAGQAASAARTTNVGGFGLQSLFLKFGR